jgi:hypothetical protein
MKTNPLIFNPKKMKKNITLLLILLSVFFQIVNAQTNPALVTDFSIKSTARYGYRLSWALANNEVINKFELQKSVNGRDYITVAILPSSQKRGAESYSYDEVVNNIDKVMYRLKMLSEGQEIYYSKIILVHAKPSDDLIRIVGNPVNDRLTLRITESSWQFADLKVYNISGILVLNLKINLANRDNIVTIPLNIAMNPGMYVAEINNGISSQTLRFIKQ